MTLHVLVHWQILGILWGLSVLCSLGRLYNSLPTINALGGGQTSPSNVPKESLKQGPLFFPHHHHNVCAVPLHAMSLSPHLRSVGQSWKRIYLHSDLKEDMLFWSIKKWGWDGPNLCWWGISLLKCSATKRWSFQIPPEIPPPPSQHQITD